MPDYDDMFRHFRIDVPEYFNFGFDIIDAWAKKDRNKLAMIWVSQDGGEKKFSFLDLANLSNKAANIVMLGAYIKSSGVLTVEEARKIIQKVLGSKADLLEINLKAFESGYGLV